MRVLVVACVLPAGVPLQPLHGPVRPPPGLGRPGRRCRCSPPAAPASERRCAAVRQETAPFINKRSEPGECVCDAGEGPAGLQMIGQLASLLLMLLSSLVLLSSPSSSAQTRPTLICPSLPPTLNSLSAPSLLSTSCYISIFLLSSSAVAPSNALSASDGAHRREG